MSTAAPVSLRLARPDDVPGICAIINHYIAHSTANFRTEPYQVDTWTELLAAHRDRYPWLVAECDGEVAGLAYATPWNPRSAYDWTAEATVYVADAHRGRRLGSLLYGELFKRLEQQGFRSVMAQVTQPNAGSEALHAACGFKRVGTIRNAGYKHGGWRDVCIWQRDLADLDDPPRPTTPVEP